MKKKKIRLVASEPKLYTLDQAYQVILLEKRKMGINEYQEKQLRQQYNRGYHDGLERCRKALSRIVEITEIPYL